MKGFTFWESYFASGNELNPKEEGELYRAIIRYAFNGEEPTLNKKMRSIFYATKPNIDLSIRRSKAKSAENKGFEETKKKSKRNLDLQIKNDSSPANQNETLTCESKQNSDLQIKSEVCSEDTDTVTDTDTDTFIYIPPTPSKEGDTPKVEDMGYTPELEQTVKEWLSYKREKRQGYKPTGLKSLLTQIKKSAEKFGDKAVSDIIQQSMSCGYQGIMFDRLKLARIDSARSKNFPQRQYDYDALEKKLLEG